MTFSHSSRNKSDNSFKNLVLKKVSEWEYIERKPLLPDKDYSFGLFSKRLLSRHCPIDSAFFGYSNACFTSMQSAKSLPNFL